MKFLSNILWLRYWILTVAYLYSFTYCCALGNNKINIVATTTFLQDITQNIVGDSLDVLSIMPTGGDPHIYDPVPQDVKTISTANLIVKNGLLLEGWLDKLIANSGTSALVINASDGLEIITNVTYHGAPDPHAWMSPQNGIQYARNISAALQAIDRANEVRYKNNLSIYIKKLQHLDQWIRLQISAIPEHKRILITSHDAFRYYGNHYGLKVESVMGTSTDADVLIGDINNLIKTIERNNIPAVFIESTINPKLLLQLAKDLGIIIGGELFADSLGDEDSGADTYIKMLRQNTTRIVLGLTSRGSGMSGNDDVWTLLLLILGMFILSFILISKYILIPGSQGKNQNNGNDILVENLTVSYDQNTVLAHLFLKFRPGILYGIIGPNGAGKSTLIKSLLGLIKYDSGSIKLNNLPLNEYRKAITYIPQKDEIDWSFPSTVLDVVMMGRYPHKGLFQRMNQNDKDQAESALNTIGIYDLKSRQIGELSGGQQQRVFLARALCQQADIYLLDEPFVGIDVTTEQKIVELLKILAIQKKTIIVIHHDLSKAAEYFDEVVLLNQSVIASGQTHDVLTDENIKKTYSARKAIFT